MNSQVFETAFERVFGHEGGYQCAFGDSGNWTGGKVGKGILKGTKYGISAASYPDLDIKNLDKTSAKAIWYRDFFRPIELLELHPAITYQMFDAGGHHGLHGAAKIFQTAVGTTPDGIIGPITLAAAESMDLNDMLLHFLAERLEALTMAPGWRDSSKGWTLRVAQNMRYAAEDNDS